MIKLKKLLGLEMYVSDLDCFLTQYDQNNPHRSHSQQNEINKDEQISKKRDHDQKTRPKKSTVIDKLLG